MAMNPIQLQTSLSMAEFLGLYGTEAKRCRALCRACPPGAASAGGM